MTKHDASEPEPCIERRSLLDRVHTYSVFEYESEMSRGRMLSHSKARAFHGVIWTEDAPEVHELSTEGKRTREGFFRIIDRDLYDQQMRQLLGIDERPALTTTAMKGGNMTTITLQPGTKVQSTDDARELAERVNNAGPDPVQITLPGGETAYIDPDDVVMIEPN